MAASISNPCRGNVDPDTMEGKKMIAKMTAGLAEEDKFDLKKENIIEFKDNLEEAANAFCCGCVMHAIPTEHDDEGNILNAANLLAETNQVTLGQVMDFSRQIWGNEDGDHAIDSGGTAETDVVVLNQRIRTSLLGMRIKSSSTKEAKKKLMLQKEKFRHCYAGNNANAYEDCGSTMARIIFSECDPSARLGVNSLKAELSDFTLKDYDQDASDMLDAMQICHDRIVHSGSKDDDFMLKIFNALETSDNKEFLTFAQKKRDLWEEDELEDNVDKLVSACIKKFNNLKKNNPKKRVAKSAKNDDQETKFMALLTQLVPVLSRACAAEGGNNDKKGNPRSGNGAADGPFSKIEPCRLVHVGDTIEKFGRTSY